MIFYAIIARDEDFTINEENARMLTPWFHESQMKKYLEECDDVLKEEVKFQAGKQDECIFPFTGKRAPKLCLPYTEEYEGQWREYKGDSFWTNGNYTNHTRFRQRDFKNILKLLELSCRYDLAGTKEEAELFIRYLMRKSLLPRTYDLFDLDVIESLVGLFLPLSDDGFGCYQEGDGREDDDADGNDYSYVSDGQSDAFWRCLEYKFRCEELGKLPLDAINNNPMLPLLISIHIREKASRLHSGMVTSPSV